MTRISTTQWLLVALAAICPFNLCSGFMIQTPKAAIRRQCVTSAASSSSSNTIATKQKKIVPNPTVVDKLPEPLPELKNNFYLLRHGQSTANVAGIISSSRSLAYSTKHGLTELGWQQGRESAPQLLKLLLQGGEDANDNKKLIFVSSPFARAYETAQACMEGLKDCYSQQSLFDIEPEIQIRDNLMERYFGKLDGEDLATYGYVWPQDMVDPLHTDFDVESVGAVATRLREVILELDETYSNNSQQQKHNIVLFSHADVLQICQLYAANMGERVGEFSSYRFTNGEVRAMKSTPDSLPDPVPLEAPKEEMGKTTPAIPK